MTDTTTTAQDAPEAPDTPQDTGQAPEPPETPTEPQDDTPDEDGTDHPGREAAKYRRKLREAEAERDALLERVETLRRAEVERHASQFAQPSAIWAAGVTVDEVLNDDGDVDPQRVTEAIAAAADRLGLAYRPRAPRPHPAQRLGDAPLGGRGDGMADVISGRRKL